MRDMIGQRLKELRTNAGITQEKISNYLNISREAYSLYETNKRQMNYDTICTIAEFYNVSTDYLLGLSDEKCRFELTTEEEELINLYRSLNHRDRKLLISISKTMLDL